MGLLFSYGTLRDPTVQRHVIGRVVRGTPDALVGYAKARVVIDGTTYPILQPSDGGVVEGEVLELSDEELHSADKYETDAYRRVKVTTKKGVEVWVYVK